MTATHDSVPGDSTAFAPGGPCVRLATEHDRSTVDAFLAANNADLVARLDELIDARRHPAFIAERDGRLAGVLTYVLDSRACEILTLHAADRWAGTGTALIDAVRVLASGAGVRRLWLVTTNDNVDGLRFYQRRGFRLATLHPGAVDRSRDWLKSRIPRMGFHGIPLRDEIELELRLDPAPDGDEAALSILGQRVALGPLRTALYPLHAAWMNDPEVGWNVFGAPQHRSAEVESAWLDNEAADPRSRLWLIYALETPPRPIGVTSLSDIDPVRGTATFRITIGSPDDRGRGFGEAATRLVLGHAFDDLGLHNVRLTLYGYNERARRTYERVGFREIGRRREALPRDGRRWDIISMDCLADEFDRRPDDDRGSA